jgi:isocitrate dehydrogenase
VQQFNAEGHLRWDSLGEFLAVGVSLEDVAEKTGNARVRVLADALNAAIGRVLETRKSPSRKVNELDNRGSHFYLALFWAQALAAQDDETGLQEQFRGFAQLLADQETTIVDEMNSAQGDAVDIGGYYHPDDGLADAAMRPSATFNQAMASLAAE